MLDGFDWVRRSKTGAELLATLECLEKKPELFAAQELGPAPSALRGPCQRCWIYPRKPSYKSVVVLCEACRAIVNRASELGGISRQSVVAWGYVNRLPRQLQGTQSFRNIHIFGSYIQDANHFLLLMPRKELKPFIQEVVIYHGADLKGLVQIVPTSGQQPDINMADALCRLVHHEAHFPFDRLRVRFYSAPYQVLIPHVRDEKGILTFDIAEFLSTLEMATVFRTVLRPAEQAAIRELLTLADPAQEQFYWGRLLGLISQTAKDMLSGWNIRQWSKDQIKLLYDLIEYVSFYQFD
jgi:hypothetical protein